MDTATRLIDQLLPGLTGTQQAVVVAGAAAVVVLLVALGVILIRRHRRRPTPVETPDPGSIVRRPIYTDPVLVADLSAHVESRDFTRELRETLEADDPDRRPEDVRRLNQVLRALEDRPDLLVDLDRNPEADLSQGRAIRVTGTVTRTPASDAAELLELGRPLLMTNGGQSRPLNPVGEAGHAPVLLRLVPDTGGPRSYLLVLDRDGLWTDHPIPQTSVTMLGVVEDLLDDRDRLELSELLRSKASRAVRDALGDRDAAETAAILSQVTSSPLKAKELVFDGPGARVAPAAIYR